MELLTAPLLDCFLLRLQRRRVRRMAERRRRRRETARPDIRETLWTRGRPAAAAFTLSLITKVLVYCILPPCCCLTVQLRLLLWSDRTGVYRATWLEEEMWLLALSITAGWNI